MALSQTREAARLLAATGQAAEIVHFVPEGDRDQVSKLKKHGGKGGAFVSELRATMIGGGLDCAMHSLKDMPGDEEAPGLVIAAYLRRESAHDAIVLPMGVDPADAIDVQRLAGMAIGTNAVRRAAYLRRLFPRAEIIHYRGAADTRLAKLDARTPQKLPDGGSTRPADALVIAHAGLARIGQPARASRLLSFEEMLPAVGQGIVAIECPADAWATRAALARIDDRETRARAEAEREMLWVLNGHCNAPIAGHAALEVATLTLKGAVISADGETLIEAQASGPADRPRETGRKVGLMLLEKGAAAIIDATRE